jgi:hypothetical protein
LSNSDCIHKVSNIEVQEETVDSLLEYIAIIVFLPNVFSVLSLSLASIANEVQNEPAFESYELFPIRPKLQLSSIKRVIEV